MKATTDTRWLSSHPQPNVKTLLLIASAWALWSGAHAQNAATPHAPETSGTAVHTFEKLRHPAARSSSAHGVTVNVAPKEFAATGWTFSLVFSTRLEHLDDDPKRSAVLVADGKEFPAVEWKEIVSRRQRREGTLTFQAPGFDPQDIEIRLNRRNEADARVFRWKGAALR